MKPLSSYLPSLVLLAVLVLAVPAARAQSQIQGTPDSAVAAVPAAQAMAALAQPPVPRKPSTFGVNTQWTYIHASQFLPFGNQVLPDYSTGTGYVTPHDDGSGYVPSYWVQLQLPNGAMIADLYANVYDYTSNAYWQMSVTLYEHDGTPSYSTLSTTTTGDIPGYTRLYAHFSSPVFHEWGDTDGDGDGGDLVFTINLMTMGTYAQLFALRFGGISVAWHRTISPAPASATFPDVPTNHWAFQYVETLAASGITQGYPDGTFRPTAAVTRAQMATFLARALGLHWPY